MTLFTVAECDTAIAALKEQLVCDPAGSIGSMSINGRTVTYRSAADLQEILRMWMRNRSDAARAIAGVGRTKMSVAKFS